MSREPRPKPILIRGARQVGKTTLVRKVGMKFDHFIALNQEKSDDRDLFEHTHRIQLIYESLKIQNHILPVELKSGSSGRMRSLFEFIDRTEARLAVRLLDQPFLKVDLKTLKPDQPASVRRRKSAGCGG